MRISKSEYYLGLAKAVSKRGTCLRRVYGSVIVLNDQVVSTGYCGAPRGVKDCTERDNCYRLIRNVPSGQRYELCRSVHSEQNAIINAARAGVSIYGGVMYIYGFNKVDEELCLGYPCLMCLKATINAGIKNIIYSNPEDVEGFTLLSLSRVVEEWNNPENDIFDEKEKGND